MKIPTKKSATYLPEAYKRTVQMVFEHAAEYASQWAAIESIAGETGCTAQTLGNWVRQAKRDQVLRSSATSEEQPVQAMTAFIDGHCGAYEIESTCKMLADSPSAYCVYAARWADPVKAPARVRRGERLRADIQRMWDSTTRSSTTATAACSAFQSATSNS